MKMLTSCSVTAVAANKSFAPVGSDTGASCNHDKVGGGVLLGHEHDLASGASEHHLVTRLGVA